MIITIIIILLIIITEKYNEKVDIMAELLYWIDCTGVLNKVYNTCIFIMFHNEVCCPASL